MVLFGNTKITKANTTTETRVMRIPREIFTDSAFPFKDNDILSIEIVGNKLQIAKLDK